MKEGYTRNEEEEVEDKDKTIISPNGSLLALDVLLAEKELIKQYRDDIDLWYRDPKTKKFYKVANYWRPEVNGIIKEIFRKKKMKYAVVILDSLQYTMNLKPYSFKLLFFMLQHMKRDNTIEGFTIRMIKDKLKMSDRYIINAQKELLEMDFMRRQKDRNSYKFMVNPGFYLRATLKTSFFLAEEYAKWPNESTRGLKFTNFEI